MRLIWRSPRYFIQGGLYLQTRTRFIKLIGLVR